MTRSRRGYLNAWQQQDRDVVLVSQRGTGGDNRLGCSAAVDDANIQGYLDPLFRDDVFKPCLEELKGKFDGLAVRVPTPNVSLVDLVMELEQEATVQDVNQALKEAASRYLGYTDEPLVSIDFQGDAHSCVVDGSSTKVIGTMAKCARLV